MEKMAAPILWFFLFLFSAIPAFSQEKTDDELLAETVALSKEVKEFEKTLGIESTEALTKSTKNQKAIFYFGINIQQKGRINLKTFSRLHIFFETEKMPPHQYSLWSRLYSVYIRSVGQFSSGESVINIDFAKNTLPSKVATILHEDLHGNIWSTEAHLANTQETLVTPLGFLVALEFFKNKQDAENTQEIFRQINYFRTISRELNSLEIDLEKLSGEKIQFIFCLEIYKGEILKKYPAYAERLSRAVAERDECAAEEAAVSEDLMYWKYFDKIIALYEKSKNIKLLIEDMKKAPGNQDELEKYLNKLNEKYSKK